MVQAVAVDQPFALSAFTTSGGAKNNNIHSQCSLSVFFKDIYIIEIAGLIIDIKTVSNDKFSRYVKAYIIRFNITHQRIGFEKQSCHLNLCRVLGLEVVD